MHHTAPHALHRTHPHCHRRPATPPPHVEHPPPQHPRARRAWSDDGRVLDPRRSDRSRRRRWAPVARNQYRRVVQYRGRCVRRLTCASPIPFAGKTDRLRPSSRSCSRSSTALLLAIAQFGIVCNNYLTLTDATRAGARKAAVARFTGDTGASADHDREERVAAPRQTKLEGLRHSTNWKVPGSDVEGHRHLSVLDQHPRLDGQVGELDEHDQGAPRMTRLRRQRRSGDRDHRHLHGRLDRAGRVRARRRLVVPPAARHAVDRRRRRARRRSGAARQPAERQLAFATTFANKNDGVAGATITFATKYSPNDTIKVNQTKPTGRPLLVRSSASRRVTVHAQATAIAAIPRPDAGRRADRRQHRAPRALRAWLPVLQRQPTTLPLGKTGAPGAFGFIDLDTGSRTAPSAPRTIAKLDLGGLRQLPAARRLLLRPGREVQHVAASRARCKAGTAPTSSSPSTTR